MSGATVFFLVSLGVFMIVWAYFMGRVSAHMDRVKRGTESLEEQARQQIEDREREVHPGG